MNGLGHFIAYWGGKWWRFTGCILLQPVPPTREFQTVMAAGKHQVYVQMKKIRSHLITAIAIVAVVFMWANFRVSGGAALKGEPMVWAYYGWPFRAYTVEYFGYDLKLVSGTETNWAAVVGNVIIFVCILLLIIKLVPLIHFRFRIHLSTCLAVFFLASIGLGILVLESEKRRADDLAAGSNISASEFYKDTLVDFWYAIPIVFLVLMATGYIVEKYIVGRHPHSPKQQ